MLDLNLIDEELFFYRRAMLLDGAIGIQFIAFVMKDAGILFEGIFRLPEAFENAPFYAAPIRDRRAACRA